MKRKQLILSGVTAVLCLPLLCPLTYAAGTVNHAVIPGDINRICYYTDFFYSDRPDDFFYYLNDRLLFTGKPDGIIPGSSLRKKLLNIVRWHRVIKKSLERYKNRATNRISLDINDPKAYEKASVILNLSGLRLTTTSKGEFRISKDPASAYGLNDYFRFALLKPGTIERELNKTLRFVFELKESDLPVPWDFGFLSHVTGLKIDASTFFKTLLENERFSLLLGIFYRLSDREIDYISTLAEPRQPGEFTRVHCWKRIYEDKEFLMGMFILSHGLRVIARDNEPGESHWLLPGGAAAAPFWNQLAGKNYKSAPFEFLRSLATRDQGKLNYLFLFAGFLPPETREALFTGPNAQKMLSLYQGVSLTDKEKLKKSQFPRFKDANFYTLLYALRLEDHRFHLPAGLDPWRHAVYGLNETQLTSTASSKLSALSISDIFDLLAVLLAKDAEKGNKSSNEIRKFMSLYTKFYQRPQLLTKEVLTLMYKKYDEYNVLVDFIEKLPIRKPGTVVKLFEWTYRLKALNKRDKALFTSLFQSLLELLSHNFKYAPGLRDYEAMIEELLEIPLDRSVIYDRIFRFLDTGLHIGLNKKMLIDVVLEGINNRIISIDNTDYIFVIKDIYRENIEKILRGQEVCPLSTLLQINQLLDRLVSGTSRETFGSAVYTGSRVTDAFNQLPYAEISRDAPRHIRDRVMAYSRDALNRDVSHLVQLIKQKAPGLEKERAAAKIKTNYLVYQLKDYLLALVYAVNAKNPELEIFLNPNLVRLHDFDERRDRTPWNYCGAPPVTDHFSEYHLVGGLSRLNLSLAAKWYGHLFKRTFIHNPAQVQSLIINLLDFYPSAMVGQSLQYNGLLVDFGMELLRDAREKGNIILRKDLIKELGTITTGYHYRSAIDYLTGKAQKHHLFFSETRKLAEIFFIKGKYLEESLYKEHLEAFNRPPLNKILQAENHRFGSIYYRTFGNLVPHQLRLFPQEAANFFASGWVSGEMIDEFKVRLGWYFYKKQMPPFLLGHVLYKYFNSTAPRFLSQNHPNDYFSTYFIFGIFNDSHLSRLLKNLQKEGHLKLK